MGSAKNAANDASTEAGAVASVVSAAVVALSAERPIMRTHPQGVPFTVLINEHGGQTIKPLLEFDPQRVKASASFCEIDSFIHYVNRHKTTNTTVVCNPDAGSFKAIIDYLRPTPATGVLDRGEHIAEFTLKHTPQAAAWLAIIKNPVAQSVFAEFLEDRYGDIVEPAGAEVLQLAKTLEIKSDVAFKSVQRKLDGEYNISFEETQVGKAGTSGEITIPCMFLLQIPYYQGGPELQIPVRIRFKLQGSQVFFRLHIIDHATIIAKEIVSYRERLEEKLILPVLAGSASVSV